MTYWVDEAIHTVDFKDLDIPPEKTISTAETMVTNALHLVERRVTTPSPPLDSSLRHRLVMLSLGRSLNPSTDGEGATQQTGDRFDRVVKVMGIELDTEWEVTEIETDQRIKIEGRSKSNGRASLTESISAEGTGCRVRIEVEYDPPLGLLGEIADKVLFERGHEEQAERILAHLKVLCEGSPTAGPSSADSRRSTDAPEPSSHSEIRDHRMARRWRSPPPCPGPQTSRSQCRHRNE